MDEEKMIELHDLLVKWFDENDESLRFTSGRYILSNLSKRILIRHEEDQLKLPASERE